MSRRSRWRSSVFDKNKVINVWYSAVVDIDDPDVPLVNPDNDGNNNNNDIAVETGDRTNTAFYLLLLALSCTVMISLLSVKRNMHAK